MVEPETNETDGSYDVASGPKEEKKSDEKERNGRSRVVLEKNGRASLVVLSIRNLYVQSYEFAIHHEVLERIRSLVWA